MPTPNPTPRREYKGAAAATTLQNPMTNADLSFVLVAANNWPTGSVGKFIVTINRGLADEEKILCDSQTTRTVACLLANRGFDGTTAQSHAAGATVECTISAFDADEWNQHTNATTGVHGVAGAVVGTTDVQSLTGKTLDAASTLGGVSGTQLAATRVPWTAYTPTLSNLTLGNGTIAGHYLQIGKTVFFRVEINLGSTTTVGTNPTIGIPVGGTSGVVAGMGFHAGSLYALIGEIGLSANAVTIGSGSGSVTATVPFTWGNGDALFVSGSYEAA